MNVYIDKECASSDFSTQAKLFLNSQVQIFTIRFFLETICCIVWIKLIEIMLRIKLLRNYYFLILSIQITIETLAKSFLDSNY